MSRFVDRYGHIWYDEGDMLIHKTYGWIGRYEGAVVVNGRLHSVVRRLSDNQRLVLPDTDWEECKEEQIDEH